MVGFAFGAPRLCGKMHFSLPAVGMFGSKATSLVAAAAAAVAAEETPAVTAGKSASALAIGSSLEQSNLTQTNQSEPSSARRLIVVREFNNIADKHRSRHKLRCQCQNWASFVRGL